MKTKTQPQHTQGEWKVDKLSHKISVSIQGTEMTICSMAETPERVANAQRIVKAVNMHDELINGLKKIANCQNSLTYYSDRKLIESVIEQAKELLKQAEQK